MKPLRILCNVKLQEKTHDQNEGTKYLQIHWFLAKKISNHP